MTDETMLGLIIDLLLLLLLFDLYNQHLLFDWAKLGDVTLTNEIGVLFTPAVPKAASAACVRIGGAELCMCGPPPLLIKQQKSDSRISRIGNILWRYISRFS